MTLPVASPLPESYGIPLVAALGVLAALPCLLLLGLPVVRAVHPAAAGRPSAWLWGIATGLSVYATALTLLGFAGLYTPAACALPLLLAPLPFLRRREELRELWRGLAGSCRAGRAGYPAAMATAGAVAVVLPAVFAPEIFYDALYYHLGLPSQYLLAGRVAPPPDVVHAAFPSSLDLVFGAALSLGGPAAAKALGLALFLLALAATAELARIAAPVPSAPAGEARGDGEGPWNGAAILAVVPGVAIMATLTSVDVGMTFAAAMAWCAFAESRLPGAPTPWRPLLLSAFPAALVAGSKYTGLYLPAVLVPLALVPSPASPAPFRARASGAAAMAAGVLLLASPWYVRNLAAHGNPFFPALPSLFGGDGAGEWALGRLGRDLPRFGWGDPGALAAALLSGGRKLGAGSDLGILLPPAFVALAALAAATRPFRPLAAGAALYFLLWTTGPQAMRYLSPIFPLAAAAGGSALSALASRGRPFRAAAAAILLGGAAFNLYRVASLEGALFSPRGELSSLLSGGISRDRYLSSLLPHTAAARWANANLPGEAVILFVGETRPLYFDRRVVFSSAYDRPRLQQWVEESADGPALADRLRREGITHLLVNRPELSRLRKGYGYLDMAAEENGKIRELMGMVRPLWSEGGIQLGELPPGRG